MNDERMLNELFVTDGVTGMGLTRDDARPLEEATRAGVEVVPPADRDSRRSIGAATVTQVSSKPSPAPVPPFVPRHRETAGSDVGHPHSACAERTPHRGDSGDGV
jgi:hypothetical protein